jgi:hypothetical protein
VRRRDMGWDTENSFGLVAGLAMVSEHRSVALQGMP